MSNKLMILYVHLSLERIPKSEDAWIASRTEPRHQGYSGLSLDLASRAPLQEGLLVKIPYYYGKAADRQQAR